MSVSAVNRQPGPLECGVCWAVWTEPITLPCGHTYCKKCVGADGPRSQRTIICKQCGKTCVSCCVNNNILLANIARKWFPQKALKNHHVKENELTGKLTCSKQKEDNSHLEGSTQNSPDVVTPSRSQAACRKRTRSSCPDLEDMPPSKQTHLRCIQQTVNSSVHEQTTILTSTEGSTPIQCRASTETKTAPAYREVDAALLDSEDFECVLCYRFLCEPVTTPCGHTFCRTCLYRSLDHSSICPLCKTTLVEFLAERRQVVNVAVSAIMQLYFPEQYAERTKIHEDGLASLRDGVSDVPVFVLLSSFPSVTCVLHIFEPRYKLMIRQTMESGLRQFAMCAPSPDTRTMFSDYGCMLEIKDVQFFPDGRCIVHTTGGRRFRVESRGTQDGYNTAKLQYLEDIIPNSSEMAEVTELHTLVHTIAVKWIQSMSGTQWQRILHTLGDFPEVENDYVHLPNGPAWIWWLTSILPLDTQAQQSILVMLSLKSRLIALKRILGYVIKRQALAL